MHIVLFNTSFYYFVALTCEKQRLITVIHCLYELCPSENLRCCSAIAFAFSK